MLFACADGNKVELELGMEVGKREHGLNQQ